MVGNVKANSLSLHFEQDGCVFGMSFRCVLPLMCSDMHRPFVAEDAGVSYLGAVISEAWTSLPAENLNQLFESCRKLLLAVPKA